MLAGVGLAEVALLCGFADQSHFSRVFARAEGHPPGAWQRRERHWDHARRGLRRAWSGSHQPVMKASRSSLSRADIVAGKPCGAPG